MKFRDYLEKEPEEGNDELIELLARRILGEVAPVFEKKAGIALEESERRLSYVATKYIENLKLRTFEYNERLNDAERLWHEERRALKKMHIEYKNETEHLKIQRKKTVRAKYFYYIAGGIWFLAVASYIIKIILQ